MASMTSFDVYWMDDGRDPLPGAASGIGAQTRLTRACCATVAAERHRWSDGDESLPSRRPVEGAGVLRTRRHGLLIAEERGPGDFGRRRYGDIAGVMFPVSSIEELDDDTIDVESRSTYVFTKAAVTMLTMTAAVEAGEHGILYQCHRCPGRSSPR